MVGSTHVILVVCHDGGGGYEKWEVVSLSEGLRSRHWSIAAGIPLAVLDSVVRSDQ